MGSRTTDSGNTGQKDLAQAFNNHGDRKEPSIQWSVSKGSQSKKQEYNTKLTLIGVFLSMFGLFNLRVPLVGKNKKEFHLNPFDYLLLVFSIFRLGRLVAYDRIFEPMRQPFTKTVPDPTGAGDSVEPRGQGMQNALGQLISCPICSGTWIAAVLVYGLQLLPGPTRAFLTITSAIGGAEFVNALTEALSWCGEAARRLAGEKQ